MFPDITAPDPAWRVGLVPRDPAFLFLISKGFLPKKARWPFTCMAVFGADVHWPWGWLLAKGGSWGTKLHCPKAMVHPKWVFMAGDNVTWFFRGYDLSDWRLRQAGER